MEAVVNLLSHKWIHLTDGAILAFAVSIIAVGCSLLLACLVWTRVRSLNQQQIEVVLEDDDLDEVCISLGRVLCVVLAALAFAVLDDPFQAVMVVWTRVMNVRQGIKDMNFLTFLAVMVLPWALLSVFFGANDVM